MFSNCSCSNSSFRIICPGLQVSPLNSEDIIIPNREVCLRKISSKFISMGIPTMSQDYGRKRG